MIELVGALYIPAPDSRHVFWHAQAELTLHVHRSVVMLNCKLLPPQNWKDRHEILIKLAAHLAHQPDSRHVFWHAQAEVTIHVHRSAVMPGCKSLKSAKTTYPINRRQCRGERGRTAAAAASGAPLCAMASALVAASHCSSSLVMHSTFNKHRITFLASPQPNRPHFSLCH